MDITSVLQLVANYGFPIVACLILGWYVYHQSNAHKEEVTELRKSVDANTEVVRSLVRILEVSENDLR